jgi:hypothetical protein
MNEDLIMTGFTVYNADGSSSKGAILWPAEPGLTHHRSLILPLLGPDCNLEHVTVLHEGKRADMFVDEHGVRKQLPRNEAATAIYRNNWLTHHPKDAPESLPAIYGTAVLFDRIVWN